MHVETCIDTIFAIKFYRQEKSDSLEKADKAYFLPLKEKEMYIYICTHIERDFSIVAANYKWCMKWKIPVGCTKKCTDSATMESTFAMSFTYWETRTQKSTEKTSAVTHFNLPSICTFFHLFPKSVQNDHIATLQSHQARFMCLKQAEMVGESRFLLKEPQVSVDC